MKSSVRVMLVAALSCAFGIGTAAAQASSRSAIVSQPATVGSEPAVVTSTLSTAGAAPTRTAANTPAVATVPLPAVVIPPTRSSRPIRIDPGCLPGQTTGTSRC